MLGDLQLLFSDIARQANLLHTVEQRPGDAIQRVSGAHEEHLGKIHPHVEIVVEEVNVLLGVKHFQQRRGGVTLERLTQLINFIQHDDRVFYLNLFERLNELTGHCAYIGASMAFDFSLIPHTAHRETIKLTSQRFGNRAANGGFTHPWRANQQHNRAAYIAFKGALGKELDNPLFHVF